MVNVKDIFVSLNGLKEISSIEQIDQEIYKFIKASNGATITSTDFVFLVIRRAIMSLNRNYCDDRMFANMRFSVHEYFLSFGVEIEVKSKSKTKTVNIRPYLTDSDFWIAVRTLQFYIEEKRIKAGCKANRFEMIV